MKYDLNTFIGKRFGRLVVLNAWREHIGCQVRKVAEVKCDCGTICRKSLDSMMRGGTTSCGCYEAEVRSIVHTKHGYFKDPDLKRLLYVWNGIRTRCYNPKSKSYRNYGGRGIKLCEEWQDRTKFVEWAMSHGYRKGLSVDRIDCNGNYAPENCRFATASEQMQNVRYNRNITFQGRTQSLSMWAREIGVPIPTLWRRIFKRNTPLEIAMMRTIPPEMKRNSKRKLLEFRGECHSAERWSIIRFGNKYTVRYRIKLGWNLEEAISIPKGVSRENFYKEKVSSAA